MPYREPRPLSEKVRYRLRQYYPPSVVAALDMWFRRFPRQWPFEQPAHLSYWSQCVLTARRRYLNGSRLYNEVRWYGNNGVVALVTLEEEDVTLALTEPFPTDLSESEPQ